MNNKGQTGGLITALIFGVASLVIGVIISFVIISTLSGANLLESNRDTLTVANESAYLNQTGYQLSQFDTNTDVNGSVAISHVYNASDGIIITSGNYSVNGTGFLLNASATNWENVTVTYTYTQKTPEELSTAKLSGNFTSGVDNVSSKIPTVLLIAAIVLILSVLAILVGVWQRMRMGGGTTL